MTPQEAKREYAGVWAEHIRTARFLRRALAAAIAVVIVLSLALWSSAARVLRPLIVRVDEVGRAEAVRYEAMEARPGPQAPATMFFLRQFLTDYYSRRQETVAERWPRSLFFVSAELAAAAQAEQTQAVAAYASGAMEEDLDVENIALRFVPRPEPPYEIVAEYEIVERIAEREVGRDRWTSVVRYAFLPEVPPALYAVNPIGLIVTYLSAAPVQ